MKLTRLAKMEIESILLTLGLLNSQDIANDHAPRQAKKTSVHAIFRLSEDTNRNAAALGLDIVCAKGTTVITTKCMALLTRVLLSLVLVIVTSAFSCNSSLNTGGLTTAFNLIVRSKADSTKKYAANVSFRVSASCLPGEQLVGGGYNLVNKPDTPTSVAIEGSYPSAASTWTVQVRNPDNPPYYSSDADVAVEALAFV